MTVPAAAVAVLVGVGALAFLLPVAVTHIPEV